MSSLPCLVYGDQKDVHGLESMTVTANKREENIQDVPSAISAFSKMELDDSDIEDLGDLVKFVPNMYSGSSMQGYQEINFRGISISQFTGKNPVVIFVDGIAQDHYSNYDVDMTNVERVEVLRGPQGTLYGKNAIGGVINIISKKPGNDLEGEVTAQAAEYDTYGVKGFVNTPLVKDKLSLSLTGRYYTTDGFMENDHPAGGTFDDEEVLSLRSRFRWIFTDRLEANFHAGMSQRWDGSGVQTKATPDKVEYHAYKNPDDKSEPSTSSAALNISYEGDSFDFTSIGTYSYDKMDAWMDQCYVALWKPVNFCNSDNRIFSQEFRIQSPSKDDGIKWLGGVYYSSDLLDYENNAHLFDTKAMYGYDLKYNWADETQEDTAAAFTQMTFPLPGKLAFTAGLRYERVNKSMDYRYEVTRNDTGEILPADPFSKPGSPKPTLVTYTIQDNWDAILPKGVLSWQPTKGAMFYASVAKGYLAGGFNLCEHIKEQAKFDEQYSIDYELGVKTSWFQNRLMCNANIFYMDINDMHVYYAPDAFTYITSNAGEAHSQGLELEIDARPVDGLDIIASFGFVDAEYDEYTNTAGIDCSGNKLVRTPDYTINLAVQYRHHSGFYSRIGMQGYGKNYFDDVNTVGQDAYELYNAKIGYEGAVADIYLYGTNLLDEEYFSFGRTNSMGLMANVGQPQTFGVMATVRF